MRWKNVPIPEPLWARAKSVVEGRPELGYHAISSFVAEAVRRRLEEIEKAQEVGG